MSSMRVGLLITMFALILDSGCSFMLVQGPPANHEQMAKFECSESNAWPVVDGIWAALNGIGAASALGGDKNPEQGQTVAVGLAWLAVSGISAIYGATQVSQCNAAKRLRDERYFGRGMAGRAPPGLPDGPEAPSGSAAAPRAYTPALGGSVPGGDDEPATDQPASSLPPPRPASTTPSAASSALPPRETSPAKAEPPR